MFVLKKWLCFTNKIYPHNENFQLCFSSHRPITSLNTRKEPKMHTIQKKYNIHKYQYTFFNNNTPHGEQRWTVLIRQLLHTFQWQHATQWATLNYFNQIIVHCANSCKQSIIVDTQQTENIWITFVQRRPNVFDAGPTLYKCYTNVFEFVAQPLNYRAQALVDSVSRLASDKSVVAPPILRVMYASRANQVAAQG